MTKTMTRSPPRSDPGVRPLRTRDAQVRLHDRPSSRGDDRLLGRREVESSRLRRSARGHLGVLAEEFDLQAVVCVAWEGHGGNDGGGGDGSSGAIDDDGGDEVGARGEDCRAME